MKLLSLVSPIRPILEKIIKTPEEVRDFANWAAYTIQNIVDDNGRYTREEVWELKNQYQIIKSMPDYDKLVEVDRESIPDGPKNFFSDFSDDEKPSVQVPISKLLHQKLLYINVHLFQLITRQFLTDLSPLILNFKDPNTSERRNVEVFFTPPQEYEGWAAIQDETASDYHHGDDVLDFVGADRSDSNILWSTHTSEPSSRVEIGIEPSAILIWGTSKLRETIIHELTHIINPYRKLQAQELDARSRGEKTSASGDVGRYLKTSSSEMINDLRYYLNPTEIQAHLSEHIYKIIRVEYETLIGSGFSPMRAIQMLRKFIREMPDNAITKRLLNPKAFSYYRNNPKIWRKFLRGLYEELDDLENEVISAPDNV